VEQFDLATGDYLNMRREEGTARLFPDAAISELNNAGGSLSSWFSTFKTRLGFGPTKVFHSFRHSVETKLKRAKEPAYHINAVTGHAQQGGEGDDTYTHLTEADYVETVELISYEGLSLPRVWSRDAAARAATEAGCGETSKLRKKKLKLSQLVIT